MKSLREIDAILFGEDLSEFAARICRYPDLRFMWHEIETHYSDYVFTLEDVACKCGKTSGTRLNERLKSKGFESFHQILKKFHVRRAAEILLNNPDARILHVAQDVGIDQSTLDRNFRELLSLTPSDLRDGRPRSRRAGSA